MFELAEVNIYSNTRKYVTLIIIKETLLTLKAPKLT